MIEDTSAEERYARDSQDYKNDDTVARILKEFDTAADEDQAHDEEAATAEKVGPLPDVENIARCVVGRRAVGGGVGRGRGYRAARDRGGEGCLQDEEQEAGEGEEREERRLETGGHGGGAALGHVEGLFLVCCLVCCLV